MFPEITKPVFCIFCVYSCEYLSVPKIYGLTTGVTHYESWCMHMARITEKVEAEY